MHARTLIDDARMPEGVDWLMTRDTAGKCYLFVRESLCVGECGTCLILLDVMRQTVAVA